MPIKWAINNTGYCLFPEEAGNSPFVQAQGRALGCHLLGGKMWGWRGLSPCIEVSHLRAEDYFLLPLVFCKTLFLRMMVAVPATSGLKKSHKRILLIAQLGSRKLYPLYCAWLNPAGNCDTIKYILP